METIERNRRRNFLLAAGLGAAGVAAVVATRRSDSAVVADAPSLSEKGAGYRASPHILKYYKTAEL